jgi:hypothetical protein
MSVRAAPVNTRKNTKKAAASPVNMPPTRTPRMKSDADRRKARVVTTAAPPTNSAKTCQLSRVKARNDETNKRLEYDRRPKGIGSFHPTLRRH